MGSQHIRKILTNEMLNEIEIRLSNGESLRSIAQTLGIGYQSIQYWRKRRNRPKLKTNFDKSGKNHPNWRGGELIDSWGYKRVYAPNRPRASKYTYEHVLVAEKKIGRFLKRGEHVHHINGNKLDNKPENLLVLTPSEHRKLHRQLEELALELVLKGEIVYQDGEYGWKANGER